MMGDTILRLVSSLRDTAVCTYRHVAIAPKRIVWNRLPFARYQSQKQKNGTATLEARQMVLTAEGLEGIRQALYLGSGVGVYQGEFVIILKWALANSPQWVIGKLQTSEFHLLPIQDTVHRLLKLAVIFARHLSSEPSMNDLQNLDEIVRWKYCPHAIEHEPSEPSYPEGVLNPICPLLYQLLEQLRQSSQRCPTDCPYMTMVNQEYGGVNQSGKEPPGCRRTRESTTDLRQVCERLQRWGKSFQGVCPF
jgi:hypothetical protein